MADVQIDDGNFTQIANVLLEKLSSAKLNGCQHAIVLVVWRYTYGFKRKEAELSAGFIANATGYNKRQVEREITSLVSRKILFQEVVNGLTRTIGFNKDFDEWETPGKFTDGKNTDGELAGRPPANKPVHPRQISRYTPGEFAPQEINIKEKSKENFKENNIMPVSEVIDYLNAKAGTKYRSSSKAAQRHIKARFNENYTLEDFKTVIDKKCAEWLGTEMEKYICPDTLFGSKFEKYLNQKIVISGGKGQTQRDNSIDHRIRIQQEAERQYEEYRNKASPSQ